MRVALMGNASSFIFRMMLNLMFEHNLLIQVTSLILVQFLCNYYLNGL